MKTLQMKIDLVQLLRKIVDQLNISSTTYYHSILIFNLVRLKEKSQKKKGSYQIIGNKKNKLNIKQPSNRKIEDINAQLKNTKLYLITCFFLAHKLYQTNHCSLSQLMQYFGIQEQYQSYILQLEIKILVLLKYKIQNLLPSHQAIFACQKWDSFIQNISISCVDVKFGIRQLFEKLIIKVDGSCLFNQIEMKHYSQNFKSHYNFQALIKNIQNLVHNQSLYDLYLRKISHQCHQGFHPMKKIGLAIIYITIVQQSDMSFNKKYCQSFQDFQTRDSKFLDFVFDDFLKSQYGINIYKIHEEISICLSILEKLDQKESQIIQKGKNNIYLIETLQEINDKKLVQFVLKGKQRNQIQESDKNSSIQFQQNHYESKIQTHTFKQETEFIGQNQKEKALESTVHRSRISQNTQSHLKSSLYSKQKGFINMNDKNLRNSQKINYIKTSKRRLTNSIQNNLSKNIKNKNLTTYQTKQNDSKKQFFQQSQYLVSHFASIQA